MELELEGRWSYRQQKTEMTATSKIMEKKTSQPVNERREQDIINNLTLITLKAALCERKQP
jgi:hypothetical protein